MTTEAAEIPETAIFLEYSATRLHNVENWWCPSCGATGDERTVDFVAKSRTEEEGPVDYCCGECFEFGIFVTFVQEDNDPS